MKVLPQYGSKQVAKPPKTPRPKPLVPVVQATPAPPAPTPGPKPPAKAVKRPVASPDSLAETQSSRIISETEPEIPSTSASPPVPAVEAASPPPPPRFPKAGKTKGKGKVESTTDARTRATAVPSKKPVPSHLVPSLLLARRLPPTNLPPPSHAAMRKQSRGIHPHSPTTQQSSTTSWHHLISGRSPKSSGQSVTASRLQTLPRDLCSWWKPLKL